MKILLIEDDALICELLVETLSTQHYAVDVADDGELGVELAQSYNYDLILLDVLLPKLDGITICRQLRSKGYQQPIILLTVKDSSTDIIAGLDAGADEYVSKPCSPYELMARIRALLRRTGTPAVSPALTWGDLTLDPASTQVTYAGEELVLTPKEYSLLELFLRNPQRVFSRTIIIDHLWSMDNFPTEGAVTNLIKDLRRRLKAAGITTEFIETIYGLGYRLNSPPNPASDQDESEYEASGQAHSNQANDVTDALPGLSSDVSPDPTQKIAAVQAVLDRFRNTFTDQIATIEQAIEAQEAQQLEDDIWQQARRDAHKLAGGLGTFGWEHGSQLARQMEYLLDTSLPIAPSNVAALVRLVDRLKQEILKPPVMLASVPMPIAQLPHVLVIDDDQALTDKLSLDAPMWGVRIDIATNPAIARQMLPQISPDVILLDLTFPDATEDGLMLFKTLTEDYPDVPILAFTGRDSLADRVAVSRLGGRGFLHKPVSPAAVFEAIAQALYQPNPTHANVMVVDDSPLVLIEVGNLLRPWGMQVKPLQDPTQFWDVLITFQPHLLILDIEMPTFSGIDLCRVVRQDSRWGDLPILIITAHTEAESIRRVFAAGADDFIAKPILGPELVTRVISRVERVRSQQTRFLNRRMPPTS
ncbi:MAG: response regulator [Elainellaceae cyanobacterium]